MEMNFKIDFCNRLSVNDVKRKHKFQKRNGTGNEIDNKKNVGRERQIIRIGRQEHRVTDYESR